MNSELDACYETLKGEPSTRAPRSPCWKTSPSLTFTRQSLTIIHTIIPCWRQLDPRWNLLDQPSSLCMKDFPPNYLQLFRVTCLELATVLMCMWIITKRGRTEFFKVHSPPVNSFPPLLPVFGYEGILQLREMADGQTVPYVYIMHKYMQTECEEGQSLSMTSINTLPLVSSGCIHKQWKCISRLRICTYFSH